MVLMQMAAINAKDGNHEGEMKVNQEEQWHTETHMRLATHTGSMVPTYACLCTSRLGESSY